MTATAAPATELQQAYAEHSADLSALHELLAMRGPTGCSRLDSALAERMREDTEELRRLHRTLTLRGH